MYAYRTITTIDNNGTLQLETLPFPAGSVVEIIVLANETVNTGYDTNLLRDSVVKYDSPMEPVAEKDWEVLK
ncbi:MAG TPA: hypothetical protein G4N94_07275 [Caldilineae bacterium]|nr:hypothetical protein [Caldilineae bacterium]